jgi:hypothetical protein
MKTLELFLVMTFAAPLLSFADDQLSLSITTNGMYGLPGYFVPGSTLVVSVSVENPGLPGVVVDFYFGALSCDGDPVVFFTDLLSFARGVGSLANPATLRPIVARVDLSNHFTFSQPTFFSYTWTGYEGVGSCEWWRLFVAAVKSGAPFNPSIDPGDILALSTALVSFDPWGY